MNQHRAPLFEKMLQLYERNVTSFHVPGHKSGRGLDDIAIPFFRDVMAIDYTEISGLDDLHQPHGVIKEAEALAADCFGAEQTYFLVNGSTVGNLAIVLATCERNDLLIVQRNVHKSVIHAMMLAGVRAVFLPPRWDEETGVATSVTQHDVEDALLAYPEARAVMVTNPNYYGMGMDLQALAELVHAHDKPLLVDEAHGAHYGFHEAMPASALACGADAVIQSTHKMLSSMTMGSMLHVQGSRVNRERIQLRLNMLQSSSPSYPIMASLDLSRRTMHVDGRERLSHGLEAVNDLTWRMQAMPWFRVVQCGPTVPPAAYETKDPFKVILSDATDTLSGYELQRQLEQSGCMIEMADARNVLLVFSIASQLADVVHLVQGLARISAEFQLKKKELKEEDREYKCNTPFSVYIPPILFDVDPHNLSG